MKGMEIVNETHNYSTTYTVSSSHEWDGRFLDRLGSDGESRRDAWNRLKPFYEEVMASDAENTIIVSHGDLLSIWNAMYLGLTVESFYDINIHGPAGGVSHMSIGDDGRHLVRHISDMSYVL